MKCPKCLSDNREEAKFCNVCGHKFELPCPKCANVNQPGSRFCDECGYALNKPQETSPIQPREIMTQPEKTTESYVPVEGERKHVTVLFSDLSGFTDMSEKLDPEEVKEIMSKIFGEIAKIIAKYEGFIEKFIGDAIVAIFGATKAYEDDPVRAIRAAREIHNLVESLNPKYEERIGQPLSMHTGINTGLVVTGEVDLEKGTHGISGDTINLTARLSGMGKAGDILVSPDTYSQAEGYFNFEDLGPTKFKGETESVQVYKVIASKEQPRKVHRIHGLQSMMVGRKMEIAQLSEAIERLWQGKGSIFSICGAAGTGKSRLIEEFKATLDFEEIQWLEGHAYAYCQNIPYFPMINFLNRVFQIEEGDPSEKVRQKIESGIDNLVGTQEDVIPYLGSLYALSYPEIEEASPEFWKSRLQHTMQMILSALAKRKPTIFLLEDLHWADPSFIGLLRHTLLEVRQPAIVLCVYRPAFTLFTSHQLRSISKIYKEIRLQDLSPSEAQDMLESLLNSDTIPSDLRRFVQEKAEGNPFYLEELVNSLIESETLIRENGSWKVTRPISETEISSTIHGVVSGRLDRLEKEMKRVLQEASVIGRAFLYEILKRITELRDQCDRCLSDLERFDLIKRRSIQPDLEYVFKHALTQEVVYNGLLKKERKIIHERIALVMEQVFQDRLPELYETLAFHFRQGHSTHKAAEYLIKSGEKSLNRFALDEAHQYYQQAYELLLPKPDKTEEEKDLMFALLEKWALVYYYYGTFRDLLALLRNHEALVDSLENKNRQGMFYAWLGFALSNLGKLKDSYQYLLRALELGEEMGSQQVIGYACAWLTWTCADLGLLDEAIAYGIRAQDISFFFKSDHYLYLKSLAGMGYTYFYKGDSRKALEAGKTLLDYGREHSNIRSQTIGYYIMGYGYSVSGEFPTAIECCLRAIQPTTDPLYSQVPKVILGCNYLLNGQFEEAKKPLEECVIFSQKFGSELIETPAQALLGAISIAEGHMNLGLTQLKESHGICLKNQRRSLYVILEHMLGKIYLQIVEGPLPSLSIIVKNIGFLIKNVPFAKKEAEKHFNRAIELAKEIGVKSVLGPAYLDLGLLHKTQKRAEQAMECLSKSIQIFEECEAEVYLKKAREALAALG